MSHEKTITIDMDGKWYNVPTVINGTQVSDEAAVEYARSNEDLGYAFNSVEEAVAAAKKRSLDAGKTRSVQDLFYLGASGSEPDIYIGDRDKLGLTSEELSRADYMVSKAQPTSAEIGTIKQLGDKENTIAGTIASLKETLDPSKPYEEHYYAARAMISELGEGAAIDEAVTQYEQLYVKQAEEALLTVINEMPELDVLDVADDVRTVLEENHNSFKYGDKLEVAHILALSGTDKQEEAERMYYLRTLTEIMKDTGLMENVWNGLGLFVPDFHWDLSDLTGTGMLDAPEALKKMIFNFQSMSVEERLAVWPQLVRDVMEASDENELKAVSKLLTFIDPTQEHINLEAFLEKLDVFAAAAPMLWAGLKGARSYKILSNIKRAGDTEQASRLNAAALTDHTGTVSDSSHLPQDLTSLSGKILRLNEDGTIPQDNPFSDSPIYSYGFRNPQGITWDIDGNMYVAELGPEKNDEINMIKPGKNYGWPEVECMGNEKFEGAVMCYDPGIEPGGILFYDGGKIKLENSFLMTSLRAANLYQLDLEEGLKSQKSILSGVGRIRDVVLGEDGSLYVITSNTDGKGFPDGTDDKLLRILK